MPKGPTIGALRTRIMGCPEFLDRVDTLLMGRKSYELLQSMKEPPFPDKQAFVFSKTVTSLEGGAILLKQSPAAEVPPLQRTEGKDLWLFGGAELTNSFLEADLVDEVWLAVHPILLVGGKPLFWAFIRAEDLSTVGYKNLFFRVGSIVLRSITDY